MSGSLLTDAGRTARLTIEATTDASQDSLIAACGSGLEPMIAAAGSISARLIEARSVPSDPRKRAAG